MFSALLPKAGPGILRPIVSYQPEIQVVDTDGKFHLIRAVRPDWCSDEEILRDLGKRFGVQTVGELVEHLTAAEVSGYCDGCSLEEGHSEFDRMVHLADERII